MIHEVTMYRVVCDHDGCDVSAQDDSDYFAWGEQFAAVDEAVDRDWYVGERGHYCAAHAPLCADPPCSVRLRDDDFGLHCEDHAPDGAS